MRNQGHVPDNLPVELDGAALFEWAGFRLSNEAVAEFRGLMETEGVRTQHLSEDDVRELARNTVHFIGLLVGLAQPVGRKDDQ